MHSCQYLCIFQMFRCLFASGADQFSYFLPAYDPVSYAFPYLNVSRISSIFQVCSLYFTNPRFLFVSHLTCCRALCLILVANLVDFYYSCTLSIFVILSSRYSPIFIPFFLRSLIRPSKLFYRVSFDFDVLCETFCGKLYYESLFFFYMIIKIL